MVETKQVDVNLDIRADHSKSQEEVRACVALRQIIKAGRRWGKTTVAAKKAVLAFSGICWVCQGEGCPNCDNTGRVKPRRVLYAAPTQEQVTKFWFEVCKGLAEGIEKGVLRKDETEHIIEIAGTELRIRAKTAWNANTLRGDFAGCVVLEEYQLMNEDVWEEVVQPMLLDNNGTAIFIFTPPSLKSEGVSKARDPRHASKLYKRALADTTGRWKCFHFTSYDNPTLSQEALGEIATDMSMDAYRREILAEDDEVEASWLVYGRFNEVLCKIKRFDIPESWNVITGHDFGSANPAALFLAQVKLPLPQDAPVQMRYGDYVLFREYAPGGGYSAIQHIEKFREFKGKHEIRQSLGGNLTTEEDIRQHYGTLGWPISPPLTGKVNAQIDRVLSLMEMNKLYIFDDLYGLVGQIASCMWELDEENKTTNKIKYEAKYHFLACLRYLCTYLPVERPIWDTIKPRKILVY